MPTLNNCYAISLDSALFEYITCGTSAGFNFVPKVNEFSFQLWVRTPVSYPNATRTLLARANNTYSQYHLYTDKDGTTITLDIGGTSQSWDVSDHLGYELWSSGTAWRHIVVSVSTTAATLYIDGTTFAPALTLSGQELAPVDTLLCARRAASATDYTGLGHFDMDEVAFWSTPLASAEVTALRNAGAPLDPSEDSGSYVSAASLVAFYRMGEGVLEGDTSPYIEDVSGNGRTAAVYQATSLATAVTYTALGDGAGGAELCAPLTFDSSSSTFVEPEEGAGFTVEKANLGELGYRQGLESNLSRSTFVCTAQGRYIDPNIFVMEYGRPVPGTSLRNTVFRRIATITDLITLGVGAENASSTFPHAYRVSEATLYGASETQLSEAWVEIQRQCAVLAADLRENGLPVGSALRGGEEAATLVGREHFSLDIVVDGESSSSAFIIVPTSSSAAAEPPVALSSSSSAVPELPTSSSSLWVDPYLFETVLYLEQPLAGDAVIRVNADGDLSLQSDLGFVRFGRGIDYTTWDTFLRFACDIPKCAEIVSASLLFQSLTSETGEDVVVKVNDAYQNASGHQAIVTFTTADPKTAISIPWAAVSPVSDAEIFAVDIADLLQFFVDRYNYIPTTNYFSLWIQEVLSDYGARRDSVASTTYPQIRVVYRTDRACSSSVGA